jgi:hypothetical protein
MKKIIISILIIVLFNQNNYSQEKGSRLYSFDINEISFYKYNVDFKIKAVKNFKIIKNQFPEELMQSLLSTSSEEWEIFNTLGGKDNADIKSRSYYDNIKKMNIDKNYFELKHKLEFEIDGVATSIIKFYFFTQDNSKPQAGLVVMQKYANRWYKTSMKMVSNIAMTCLRLKTEEFEKIILGDVSNNQLEKINKKVFVDEKLDFNELNKEIDSWYSNDSVENKSKKDYFKDPYSIL